jgi:hypothetical protein|tara:strand:- start:806 stop:988 length:183 start_codon:yes stop_codon:yes gene_type:complete
MEVETQGYKLYDLEFLDGDYIYVGSDIKAKNLEEAKRVALVFLQIPEDSELISSRETWIH